MLLSVSEPARFLFKPDEPVSVPVTLSDAPESTWKAPSAPRAMRATLRVLLPPETITPPLVRVRVALPLVESKLMPVPARLRALKVRLALMSSVVMKPTPIFSVSVETGASAELMLV